MFYFNNMYIMKLINLQFILFLIDVFIISDLIGLYCFKIRKKIQLTTADRLIYSVETFSNQACKDWDGIT